MMQIKSGRRDGDVCVHSICPARTCTTFRRQRSIRVVHHWYVVRGRLADVGDWGYCSHIGTQIMSPDKCLLQFILFSRKSIFNDFCI